MRMKMEKKRFGKKKNFVVIIIIEKKLIERDVISIYRFKSRDDIFFKMTSQNNSRAFFFLSLSFVL